MQLNWHWFLSGVSLQLLHLQLALSPTLKLTLHLLSVYLFQLPLQLLQMFQWQNFSSEYTCVHVHCPSTCLSICVFLYLSLSHLFLAICLTCLCLTCVSLSLPVSACLSPVCFSARTPVQVLVVKTEVSGREGGVGGVREVLKEQEVSYWLPGKTKSRHRLPR